MKTLGEQARLAAEVIEFLGKHAELDGDDKVVVLKSAASMLEHRLTQEALKQMIVANITKTLGK